MSYQREQCVATKRQADITVTKSNYLRLPIGKITHIILLRGTKFQSPAMYRLYINT